MTRFVVDAYAWIEYLAGSQAGEKVKLIITNEHEQIYTSSVTIAEVISKIKRQDRDYETAYKVITTLSKPMIVDEEASKSVGLLHAQIRKKITNFGLADAYVLHLAKSLK